MKIVAIAACDNQRGIGRENKLPWHLPEDLAFFQQKTKGHTILMGRSTYDSLPPKRRPLPGRKNIIVSRTLEKAPHPDVELVGDLTSFLTTVSTGLYAGSKEADSLWIIGGGKVYAESMPFWDEIYLTRVDGNYECDTFFPQFERDFKLDSSVSFSSGTFEHYLRALSSAG